MESAQELKAQCPFCRKDYDPISYTTNTFMVECTDCKRWTHRGCDGITEKIYEELSLPQRANEPYHCILCRKEGESRFASADLNAMVQQDQPSDKEEKSKTAARSAAAAEAWKAPPDLFSTLWGIVR